MVIYLHRAGGQSQFSERFSSRPSADAPADSFDLLLDDVVAHPDRDWTVERMAAGAAMSRRHFRTGSTPARWTERVRVDAARMLLDEGNESVAAIADEVGFGSVHTMRQAFQRVVGLSPTHYQAMHPTSAGQRTRESDPKA